ncbi:AAA ATPase midasin [Podochytrium sp. JEL0797]|nr:AAA ATPase midasin [Podochytrium sp. JEL0797]
MTGIGIIQTSQLFQQSGWLPVTLFFVVFMIISSLCALFIVEAMQAIPGNRYFQGTVEFGTLINFYFGPTAHILGQMGLYGAFQAIAVASIIQSSQTMDNLFIDVFKQTCGVSLGITNATSTVMEWYCVREHGTSISPFGDQFMLFTGGYLAVAALIVPMFIFPLAEIVWVQTVTFVLTIAIFFEWIVVACMTGFTAGHVPIVGDASGYAGLVGVVMLNYAFVQTIPAWVNVRRPDVNIQESIWVSTGCGLTTYLLTGLLPALAYNFPANSNLISVMTLSGGTLSKVFGYLFSLLVLMMSVPVLLVVTRSNLDQNFKMPRGTSIGLSYVVPWILAIPFLTGNFLLSINVWGSLIFVTAANFVVPLVIYLKAVWFRKAYNQRRYLTKKQRDLLKIIHGGTHPNTTQSRMGGVVGSAIPPAGTTSEHFIPSRNNSCAAVATPISTATDNVSAFVTEKLFGASQVSGIASASADTVVSAGGETQKSKGSLLTAQDGSEGVLNPLPISDDDAKVLSSSTQIPVLVLHEAVEEGGVATETAAAATSSGGVVLAPESSIPTTTVDPALAVGWLGQLVTASPIPSPSPASSLMDPACVTGPTNPPSALISCGSSDTTGPAAGAGVAVASSAVGGSTGFLVVPGSSMSLFTSTSNRNKTPSGGDLSITSGTDNDPGSPIRMNSGFSGSSSLLSANGGGGGVHFLLQPLAAKKKVSLLVPGSDPSEDANPSSVGGGDERPSVVESLASLGVGPTSRFAGLRGGARSGVAGSMASLASRMVLPPALLDLDVEQEGYLLEDVPDPDDEEDEDEDGDEYYGRGQDDLESVRFRSLFDESAATPRENDQDYDDIEEEDDSQSVRNPQLRKNTSRSINRLGSFNPERQGSFGGWFPWGGGKPTPADILPLSRYNTWGSTPEITNAMGKKGIWNSIKNLRSPLFSNRDNDSAGSPVFGRSRGVSPTRSERRLPGRSGSPVHASLSEGLPVLPGLGYDALLTLGKLATEEKDVQTKANQSSGTVLNEDGVTSTLSANHAPSNERPNASDGAADPRDGLAQSNLVEIPKLMISTATNSLPNETGTPGPSKSLLSQTVCESPVSDICAQEIVAKRDTTASPTAADASGGVALFKDRPAEIVCDSGLLVTLTRAVATPTPSAFHFASGSTSSLPQSTTISSKPIYQQDFSTIPSASSESFTPTLTSHPRFARSELLPHDNTTNTYAASRKGSATSLTSEVAKLNSIMRYSVSPVQSHRGSVASGVATGGAIGADGIQQQQDQQPWMISLGSDSSGMLPRENTPSERRDTQATMLERRVEKLHADKEEELDEGDTVGGYLGAVAGYWNRIRGGSGNHRSVLRQRRSNVIDNERSRERLSVRGGGSVSRPGSFCSAEGNDPTGMLRVPQRFMTMNSVAAEEIYRRAMMQLGRGKEAGRPSVGGGSFRAAGAGLAAGRVKPMKAFRSIPKSFPLAPRTLAILCLVLTCVTSIANIVYTFINRIHMSKLGLESATAPPPLTDSSKETLDGHGTNAHVPTSDHSQFSYSLHSSQIGQLSSSAQFPCGVGAQLNTLLSAPIAASVALEALSSVLLRPCATSCVAAAFRPLLLELAARWLLIKTAPKPCSACGGAFEAACDAPDYHDPKEASPKHTRDGANKDSSAEATRLAEHLLVAFSKLLPVAPQLFVIATACLEKSPISPVILFTTKKHLHLIKAIYNLTRGSHSSTFVAMWDFAPLFAMLHAEHAQIDPLVVAYMVHTMANVLGMSDHERDAALKKFLPLEAAINDSRICLLRVLEEEQVQLDRGEMLRPTPPPSGTLICQISAQDLSPHVVDVAGIVLPKPNLLEISSSSMQSKQKLVWTQTTRKNLNRIAVSVSIGAPVLVTGGAGVGKTSLVEEVARMVGQKDLLKIHLGDQTDSKILLGTYVCQNEPGSFRWQPGILTTAVMQGRWVLIEDLDLAPLEVVSVLIPLLETGHLFIPARGEKVRARQGFQLFATQTVSSAASKFGITSRGGGGGSGEMGAALWNRIAVDALPQEEMVQVISALYPNLGPTFAPLIVHTFESLVGMFRTSLGMNRAVSFRDVIKWCCRLDRLHVGVFVEDAVSMSARMDVDAAGEEERVEEGTIESVSLQARECLFREAVECFTSMIMDRKIRDRAMAIVAEILVIPATRLEFYSEHYLPVLSVAAEKTKKVVGGGSGKGKVTVGRASLSFARTPAKTFETGNTFANTSLSLRLLEKLAVCVSMQESVLLTGETGTGKTTIIQQLATMCGKSLNVINMSQQSDSSDLLGGFKPVEATMIALPMLERFEALFSRTFSATANAAFLESVRSAYIRKKWDVLKQGFGNSVRMADKVLGLQKMREGEPPAKRSKKLQADPALVADWEEFSTLVKSFSAQLDHLKNSFLFSFVEGTLVKAITRGDWILLDEVNLASAETLESLSGILQSPTGSILLLERGDTEPIKRHPDFRLFACMNPANDAGKRDLPPGLLSRFTEMWVDSPDTVPQDLALIIRRHLHSVLPPPTQGGNAMVADISDFHTAVKTASDGGFLVDGSGHKVYFNLRTLTRALGFASSCTPKYGLRRSVYEGCQMTYATILGKDSLEVIHKLFEKHLLNGIKNMGSFLKSIPKIPDVEANAHILFGAYWIQRGPLELQEAEKYVLTPSVEMNLSRLARAVMSSKYPVLIQGPTSAGKTSMVEYLAARTGHRFIRVNNHEHTDLQEYIGTYVSNAEGKLVFREGVLVEALRKGHWIVLDELNLAPSDVMESLNRLLDDNRELLIPETQEIVRPHPGFMLFATQNPPGLYGGRKQLSRAFRSRFIELHFDDIPEPELSIILEKRCRLPPSHSAKIVATYKGLQNARQRSRIFEGKNAFATLRDLFRWGNRPVENIQDLAENGFMVLAEKSRREDEKQVVREVLEQTFRLKIDPSEMYDRDWKLFMATVECTSDFVKEIVWTDAMKRLFVLVLKCIANAEPILLVGETGCGKTTVCQILTTMMGINLQIVNAHAGSETSDFLGSMRPVRGRDRTVAETLEAIAHLWESIAAVTGVESDAVAAASVNSMFSEYNGSLQIMIDLLKTRMGQLPEQQESWDESLAKIDQLHLQSKKMFEWSDGPLVNAMRKGEAFLLDEISLADDSVLERLNSVLESDRLLVLAERGAVTADGVDDSDVTHSHVEEIRGHQNFSFMATMNPGGDYGKKELSPALRNRFTELWVPSIGDKKDLTMIINQRLESLAAHADNTDAISELLLDFLDWFAGKLGMLRTSIVSLRDIMAWVAFITTMVNQGGPSEAADMLLLCKSVFHGGCMVLLDGIGVNPLFGTMLGSAAAATFRKDCSQRLAEDIYARFLAAGDLSLESFLVDISFFVDKVTIVREDDVFGIPPFLVKCGPEARKDIKFALHAPTTSINALRVLRALRLSKPVLLEGSPGVGKSSLIESLATTCGYSLCRINLSEQTDLMDLFGSDLPVEGGKGGEFAWRDGPFLSAMKTGQWVLLDELNLATQQVLEGLNACLDHRASVYIPELNQTFDCHANFRVFAAQNPQNQGGGRKGLPKSFVNRFTQVYIEALTGDDMEFILKNLHPEADPAMVKQMIDFNQAMHHETMVAHAFGSRGSPWEFNLRDTLRWIELVESGESAVSPQVFLNMMYCQKMRTNADEAAVLKLFNQFFTPDALPKCAFEITESVVKVGSSVLRRVGRRHPHSRGYVTGDKLEVLSTQLPVLESLIKCVEMSWMAILCGSASSGKTAMVRLLAKMAGQQLDEFSMNSGIDAVELLGGFEQVDLTRREQSVVKMVDHSLDVVFRYFGSVEVVVDRADFFQRVFSLQTQLRGLSDTSIPLPLDAMQSLLDNLAEIIESVGTSLELFLLDAGAKLPADILEVCQQLRHLRASGVHGQFEWIDGTLIKALEEGRWILIDNANMCPASVLDRLNHLLEPKGVLIVNERGLVDGQIKVIHPHPNFRMFMTMDPQLGEISRAMRNRGVELFIRSSDGDQESAVQSIEKLQDVVSLLNTNGLPGAALPAKLLHLHKEMSVLFRKLHVAFDDSNSMLIKFVRLAVERLERGVVWSEAAKQSILDVYVDLAAVQTLPEEAATPLLDCVALVVEHVSGQSSRPVDIAAGSWPIRISGRFTIEESNLSRVTMESSLVLKFATAQNEVTLDVTSGLATELQDLLLPLPKVSSLLRSSCMQFVEHSMVPVAVGIKARLLHHVTERYAVHAAAGELEIGAKLLEFVAASTEDPKSPKFDVLLRLCEFEIIESVISSNSVSSIISQSKLFFHNQVSEHNLAHPVFKYLYAFLHNLRECILAILSGNELAQYDDIQQVLYSAEYLLRLLDSESLNPTDLVFAFQSTLQTVKKSPAITSELTQPSFSVTEKLLESIEGCYSTLDIRSFESLSALWRNSSVKTLRNEPLIEIEQEFTSLSSRLSLEGKSVKDAISHPLMVVESKIKHSILEAVSTLYYLDESSLTDESADMLKMISQVPTDLTAHFDALDASDALVAKFFDAENPLQEPLTALETLGGRGVAFGLMPITEIKSLRTQSLLLARLTALILDSDSMSKKKADVLLLVGEIQDLINYEIGETLNLSQNLQPLQRIVWMLNSKWINSVADEQFIPQIKDILYEAAYRYHQRMWQNSCTVLLASDTYKRDILICHGNVHEVPKAITNAPVVNILSGPEILRQSMNTKMGMNLLGTLNHVPIYGFQSKVDQIQKLATVLNEPLVPDYVLESLKGDVNMVFLLLEQIVSGHEHYFVAETFAQLTASLLSLRGSLLVSPHAAASTIESIKGQLQPIPEKQNKYLRSVFDAFSEIAATGLSVSVMGKVWVSVSMAFLRSYLPSTPIDPALSAQTQLDILSSISERIKSDILVNMELDFLAKADSQTSHEESTDSLRGILASQKKIRSRMVYRPEQSQIGAIVNDLSHLGNNVLRDEIVSLCLADANDTKQKTFLQESLQAFIQRMETKYPLYRDILQPVFLSVYQLRLGLSSLAADQEDYYEISSEVNRLMGCLLEFTGFLKPEDLTGPGFSSALKDISKISSKENEISTLISVIRRFCWGIEYQQHISESDLVIIHDWFNELSEKWVEAEALVSKHEKEKDELYKFKERTHEVLTEAEIEEADLLEIFPDFYDEFEEVQDEEDPHVKTLPALLTTTTPEPSTTPVKLDDSVAFEVRAMHEQMFRATSVSLTNHQLRESYQTVYMNTFEASAKVFDTTINPLDFKYELSSRAGKIVVAQMRLDSLTAIDEEVKMSENFDFYRDHNVTEAQRLQSMLKTLDGMVGKLIDEWPENAILLNIRVMNNRLASFAITSPIMKLLTGVELLFQKCHEWETYASSAVSLKSHLEQMTLLIVRWRKLELQSWKNLLKNEDRLADMKSSKLWFHLFRSLIGPALAYASDDSRGEANEAELVAILDQLILSSSIGEYEGRLNLVMSFHKHLAAIRKEARFTKSIDTMMNVLWNIHRYYSQFSEHIKAHIEAQRKPIVKELDGYVRIATWKDVNVYALKESSKKSHYHLHKFVKKYREILGGPVGDVITAYTQQVVLESGVVSSKKKKVPQTLYSPSEASLISTSEIAATWAGQRDCSKYLARMRSLSRVLVADPHNESTKEGVEDLITTIIERIQFFQTPPEEGATVVKGQRMIRKKALVDLLKYLEYLGLSPNSSVRHSSNQDPTYLFSRPKLDVAHSLVETLRLEGIDTSMNATSATLFKQADVYFFKVLTRMASVREASISYNKDISDREKTKSLSFLEHLLHMLIDERNTLAAAVASVSAPALECARRCFMQLKGGDKGRFAPLKAGYEVTQAVIEAHKKALDETDAFITQALIVMECICKAGSLSRDAIAPIAAIQASLTPVRTRISAVLAAYCFKEAGALVPFLVTSEIHDALESVASSLSQALTDLQRVSTQYASISWLFDNVCARISIVSVTLNESLASIQLDTVSTTVSSVAAQCDTLVDAILVAFQDLRPKPDPLSLKHPHDPIDPTADPEIDEFGLQKSNLASSHATFKATFQDTRVATLAGTLETILRDATRVGTPQDVLACSHLVGHMYPLLQQYLLMYQFKVYELVGFHRVVSKLAYVLSNSFSILFKNGFCLPKDEEEQDDSQQDEEAATGMGIGEGEGTKDVSNEIEDESQVEGLKNDEPAPKPDKKLKEEKEGVEMDGDFDGALEDVSDDGENDESGDEKEEKETDQEQMGDLDRDLADVVDEKLWDGDDEKQQEEEAKTERDSKAESKPGEMDLVAKEEDSKAGKEPPPKPEEKDAADAAADEAKEEDGGDEEDGDDEPDKMPEDDRINDMDQQYEDNTGVKPTSGIEDDDSQEKGDEEDEMDLPEDMNLDDGKDGGKEDDGMEDMNLDKDDDQPDSPMGENQDLDDMEEEKFPTEDAEDQMDRLDENAEDEEMAEQEDEPTAGDDPVQDQLPKENQEVMNTEQPDEEKEGEEEEEKPQTNARDKNLGNADTQTTKDEVVNAAAETENDQNDNSNDANATADSGQDSQRRDGGANDVANERESQDQNESERQKNQDSDFNPHRSLGDATKKWMNRIKNLFDRDTTLEEKPQPDVVQKDENEAEEGDDFEFVENDESSFDAQVLHSADSEQMNQMDQKALAEEKTNDDLMDVDEEEPEDDEADGDASKDQAPKESKNEEDKMENQGKVKNGPKFGKLADKDEKAADEEDEEEAGEQQERDLEEEMLDDERRKLHEATNGDMEDEDELEPLDEAALQELRLQLQESTDEWRKHGQDLSEARALWRSYSSLTRELSFALCESLRLILEPTLATKLKGDYRAGKRLNMRKVIAYIASQFKKDKIWLRRTRPSKRTYQIMITIDDSKSMAESKSVELAFESLSMISKALTQLEVGEISVVSFGEQVRQLHPFDKPFSDESGAEVIHNFTFNQDGTHVRKMMETTTDLFQTARHTSQGSSELWQLQIIISDGILEDHAAVRALVRQAANARIMVVFVVLDKRGDRDSILRMTNVSYTSSGLQMTRYMDTFPFDFYVVLNRIEDLPEVLSDTLRQYFSFVTL